MNTKPMNAAALRAKTLTLAVAAAMATGTATAEEWQWSATPYVWATDLGVEMTLANQTLVDTEIAFEDLVETLDSAVLVRVEGMRGEHGMAFDLFNVELVDTHTSDLAGEIDNDLTLDLGVRLTIIDAAGIYDAGADGEGFALIYGARMIEQRSEINLALNHAGTTIGARSVDETETLTDGLIGFRYTRELKHNLRYQFAADVSTGDTEYTWSAGPTIAYAFGDADRYEVTAGYRYMAIDYDTPEHVDSDMSMSGLLVGFRLNF